MAQTFFADLAARGIVVERVPYAVNIGCGDGMEYEDPVYPLYAAGFQGVAIDSYRHEHLEKNLGRFDVVLKPGTSVSSDNIVSVLNDAGCPLNPSFLKIDIDGVDADILRAILQSGMRPVAIQAEVNTEIPPPYAFAVCSSDRYRPGSEHGFFGFSLSYGVDLLEAFGYRLVSLDFETGWTHDGLWVHETILARSGLPALDADKAFMERPAYLYHVEAASKEALTAWRTRTDRVAVRNEIWTTMLEACRLKLGHAEVPFELYISPR